MIEVEAKLKKWGRSFGIVIPMEAVREEGLSEKDKLRIIVSREKNPLKETFGILKFKKSTQELLDESDRESWGE